MAKHKTPSTPSEAARTPGKAEGERDPADQNDRLNDDILNQADDDEDEDDFEDDELEEEADEDEP